MIVINGVEIDPKVLSTKFACDYEACKGACCKLGGSDYEGPSITKEEKAYIDKHDSALLDGVSSSVRHLLPKHLTYVGQDGGDYVSVLTDNSRCALCNGKGCILQQKKADGILSYGIPVSCNLYPLVVSEDEGVTRLEVGDDFAEWHACDPGYRKGERENTYLVNFCKDAIIRRFGKEFFEDLKKLLR